jgi:PKD repeat protein
VGAVELACEDIVFSNFRVESICSSSAVDLVDLSKGSIDSYQWTVLRDGTEVQSSASESPYLFISEPGSYSISLTVANDVLEESYTADFDVIENDIRPIELVENNDGLVATLVLDEYQWYFEDELTDFNTRLISPNRDGTYRVGYRSTASEIGCTNTVSDSYIFVVAGIDEETGTVLYPNPVSDILRFKSNQEISSISIVDLQGRVVRSYENGIENQLDISDLPKGMYNVLIIFTKNNQSKEFKIIKK